MKNPLTPAEIEPATFLFVAQHLNHCATVVPLFHGKVKDILFHGKRERHFISWESERHFVSWEE